MISVAYRSISTLGNGKHTIIAAVIGSVDQHNAVNVIRPLGYCEELSIPSSPCTAIGTCVERFITLTRFLKASCGTYYEKLLNLDFYVDVVVVVVVLVIVVFTTNF